MKVTPFTPDDLPVIQKWLSEESLFYLTAIERPCFERPNFVFMIRLEDGSPVGWVDLFNVDDQNRKAELGIAIPDDRGRGLSIRATRRVVDFAFNQLGLHRITLRIPEGNKVSLALAEMYGFQREGIERNACYRNNAFEDIIVYGLLKE